MNRGQAGVVVAQSAGDRLQYPPPPATDQNQNQTRASEDLHVNSAVLSAAEHLTFLLIINRLLCFDISTLSILIGDSHLPL